MGAGRRRGRDPRGPRQHAGGAVDGDAELPAAIPGSEQGIPVSIRSNVRVGLQRQAGDRGVRAGTVGRAVRHHLPYMSRKLIPVARITMMPSQTAAVSFLMRGLQDGTMSITSTTAPARR